MKKILLIIWHILYNKRYARGSLYGCGIFPFWIYVKYFGKPVYKLARRNRINVYFSLMAANILGSLAHVRFFINPSMHAVVFFIISLFVMASVFYGLRKLFSK